MFLVNDSPKRKHLVWFGRRVGRTSRPRRLYARWRRPDVTVVCLGWMWCSGRELRKGTRMYVCIPERKGFHARSFLIGQFFWLVCMCMDVWVFVGPGLGLYGTDPTQHRYAYIYIYIYIYIYTHLAHIIFLSIYFEVHASTTHDGIHTCM